MGYLWVMQAGTKIASADSVTLDNTLLFTIRNDDGEDVEAFLTRFADGVAAFRNFCSHWTDARLDRGSGAPIRNGELVCRKHGATFEKDTGYCNFGPCEGDIPNHRGRRERQNDLSHGRRLLVPASREGRDH